MYTPPRDGKAMQKRSRKRPVRPRKAVPSAGADRISRFKPEGILLGRIGKRFLTSEDIATIASVFMPGSLEGLGQLELPEWWRGERAEVLNGTRQEILIEQIEMAAALYARDQMWENQPRQFEVASKLEAIQKKSIGLLRLCTPSAQVGLF